MVEDNSHIIVVPHRRTCKLCIVHTFWRALWSMAILNRGLRWSSASSGAEFSVGPRTWNNGQQAADKLSLRFVTLVASGA